MTLAGGRVWKWALAAVLCPVAIIGVFSLHRTSNPFGPVSSGRTAGLSAAWGRARAMSATTLPVQMSVSEQPSSTGPMIIRTVSLRLHSEQPDAMRSRVDEIVRRNQGYIDTLAIRTEIRLGRALSAILRIPVDRLESVRGELKSLGNVLEESESSQDSTAGYIDLVARLSNSRRTEQRLLMLLSNRAGKLGEVVEVEKEIGEIRERIEKMEAQQRTLNTQVQFASINLEITDEEPQLRVFGTRMHRAFEDGYGMAIANSGALVIGALRYGPTVLVYMLLLVPLIVVYRRLRVSRRTA